MTNYADQREGFRPRWITAFEFSIILQIIQKLTSWLFCSLLLRNSAICFRISVFVQKGKCIIYFVYSADQLLRIKSSFSSTVSWKALLPLNWEIFQTKRQTKDFRWPWKVLGHIWRSGAIWRACSKNCCSNRLSGSVDLFFFKNGYTHLDTHQLTASQCKSHDSFSSELSAGRRRWKSLCWKRSCPRTH